MIYGSISDMDEMAMRRRHFLNGPVETRRCHGKRMRVEDVVVERCSRVHC
jgi:hypothetical protein